MKANTHRVTLYATVMLASAAGPASSAEIDYFLNPPGCAWGRVLFTNFMSSRALALGRCSEGFVVAGDTRLAGDTYDSALVAVLAEDGTVIRSNIFPGLEYPVWGRLGSGASAVIPSQDSLGRPDGYIVCGYKMKYFAGIPGDPRPEWLNPALWIMKTDLQLQPVWQTNLDRGWFEYGPGLARWGTGVALTPDGWLVTGQGYADYLINPLERDGGSTGLGCMVQLDGNGQVLQLWEAQHPGNEWLTSGPKSIEATTDGGYILAIHDTLLKLSALRIPLWTNAQPVWNYDAKQRSGGGYAVVGRTQVAGIPPSYQNTVLASYSAGGSLEWSSVLGRNSANDIERSLLEAAGGLVAAGETDSMGAGDRDVWVIRTDAAGAKVWDVALGGTGKDIAYAAVLSADARYVVGGQAQIGTNNWMWVLKVRSDLHVPVAAFSLQPASPVFRDQVVTFDASTSSNPGGSIASYRWDFGDGTTGTGVTVQHSYSEVGTYDVILEVLSADGPRSWATNTVEVSGLVMQWQRFYGRDGSEVSGLVESADGGFVLAGATSDAAGNHLWVFKIDRRGLPVWEKLFDGPRTGTESAGGIVRGPDGSYVIAGHFYSYVMSYWYDDVMMLKVGEDGEPIWPLKLFGMTNQNEAAFSLAPAIGGGYFLAGNDNNARPLLIRTGEDGTEVWTRHYEMEAGRTGDQILATSDGGALFYARANGYRDWLIRTDSSGLPLWTNVMPYRGRVNWLGTRHAPEDGFVLAGSTYEDIWLSFVAPDGTFAGSHSWSGPAVYDQNDIAYGAALTPDGGYILTGSMWFQEEVWGASDTEVFLLKTDSTGERIWTETFPGSLDYHESGEAILALTNGSYVVLGNDGKSATPPVWIFKLAPNHAPTAVMQLATNVIAVGEALLGNGSASSDRDGSVALLEWAFGDGQAGLGASVSHSYTNSGTYEVRLTAVDDKDAERSVTNTVYVSGIRTSYGGFTIADSSITYSPGSDPVTYPREGVPLMVDWVNSCGFVIRGTATSGSTKKFRITFPEPVPAGLVLYRLPGWTQMPYTMVDAHTIEVDFWLYAGSYDLPFVFARAAPLPTISACEPIASTRLSLSFPTAISYRYKVQLTSNLRAAWSDVLHARNPVDPASLVALEGSGATETVFVDLPAETTGFFRIRMEAQ